jgi:hypothetical protein
MLGLFVKTIVGLAESKDLRTSVKFGRYDLLPSYDPLKGQKSPLCNAIGQELKTLRPIPVLKSLRLDNNKPDPSHLDLRCDFPIFRHGSQLNAVNWQSVDLLNDINANRLARKFVADNFLRSSHVWDIQTYGKKEQELIEKIQGNFVSKLILNGFYKLQKTELNLPGGKKLTAYRINDPQTYIEPETDSCRYVFFDPSSSFDSSKFSFTPIIDVFYYNETPYAFMQLANSIGIMPLEVFDGWSISGVSSAAVLDGATCQFEQKR